MTWKEIIFICKPTLHCSPPCTTFPTYRLLPCPRTASLSPPSIIGCRLKLAWNSAAGASFVAKFYWITRACLGSDQDLSLSLWHELRLMWHTDRGEAREESRSGGRGGSEVRSPLDYHACENSLKLFCPDLAIDCVAVAAVLFAPLGGTCNHFSCATNRFAPLTRLWLFASCHYSSEMFSLSFCPAPSPASPSLPPPPPKLSKFPTYVADCGQRMSGRTESGQQQQQHGPWPTCD